MRSFSFAGSLLVVLAAGPAPASATTLENPGAPSRTIVADQSSPAGMQERSRRGDVDSDEVSPDDADAGDDSENDDSDRGPLADRAPDDAAPPDDEADPYERGYGSRPDADMDRDGSAEGYEDGDRDGPSDEDDDDNDSDDDSGIHRA